MPVNLVTVVIINLIVSLKYVYLVCERAIGRKRPRNESKEWHTFIKRVHHKGPEIRYNVNDKNNIAKWNLMNEIRNPNERSKNKPNHYSTILHLFMNTHWGKLIFKFSGSYLSADVISRLLWEKWCQTSVIIGRYYAVENPIQNFYDQSDG